MSQQLTDWANIAQIAQALVALILLIYAVVFAKDIRESVRARHLDGMKYVRDLIATPEAAEKRKWVYQGLKGAARPLSPEDDDRTRSICRDFDNIGFLCRKGLLPADVITETYRRNILDMWDHLSPLVRGWRQAIGDPVYFWEFEWLAKKAANQGKLKAFLQKARSRITRSRVTGHERV